MQKNPNLNFDLLQNGSLLASFKPKERRKKKDLFSMMGMTVGIFISILSIVIENYLQEIPLSFSLKHLTHLITPAILGSVGGVLGFFYDRKINKEKTMFKALFESQQAIHQITDNLPVLISYIDADWTFRFCNNTYQDWYRRSLEELYGKHIQEIIGENRYGEIRPYIIRCFSNEIVSYENTGIFPDGEERYLQSILVPHELENGKINGVFALINDITDIRKSEEHIKMSNTFKLLENLLEWSRLQAGGITFTPTRICIGSLVKENIRLLKEIANQKEINRETDLGSSYVFADKEMINSVVRNLLINSFKFSFRNGSVTISEKYRIEKSKGYIELSIADTGTGIPREKIEKLFGTEENFTTSGTENEKGTGLGLILCKEFVEKNGGKIWAESVEGKGSTFRFTIPLEVQER